MFTARRHFGECVIKRSAGRATQAILEEEAGRARLSLEVVYGAGVALRGAPGAAELVQSRTWDTAAGRC